MASCAFGIEANVPACFTLKTIPNLAWFTSQECKDSCQKWLQFSLCKVGVIKASPSPSKKGCNLNGFRVPRLGSWLSQTIPRIKAHPVCPTKYPGPMLLCKASERMRDIRDYSFLSDPNLYISISCILCFTRTHCTISVWREKNPITQRHFTLVLQTLLLTWCIWMVLNLKF